MLDRLHVSVWPLSAVDHEVEIVRLQTEPVLAYRIEGVPLPIAAPVGSGDREAP